MEAGRRGLEQSSCDLFSPMRADWTLLVPFHLSSYLLKSSVLPLYWRQEGGRGAGGLWWGGVAPSSQQRRRQP